VTSPRSWALAIERSAMNIQATFLPVSIEQIRPLRDDYLDRLLAAQEALIEVLVQQGQCFAISAKGQIAGYSILHEQEGLLEFHVLEHFQAYAHLLLRRFVLEHRVRAALVKSFDHLLLACAMDIQTSVRVRGILVRNYIPRQLPIIPRIRYGQRPAEERDLARVRALDQQVFTHPERLAAVIRAGAMRLFERDLALIGFGIIRPVIAGRPEVDLGLAVDAPFRNKGYAIYFLRDMANFCLQSGLVPISGCAADNEASIRLGSRVGFVSRYRLLEVRFDASG
jgi:GNAT superfamily N-acetyltransferase